MNILTIISEYNPFHLGHEFHLAQSINIANSNYKIAIISGNFVQRGSPSIINKWEKTMVALQAGFDLVIELPTIYAISSAENFANGAIKIANQLKTNYLSFGTENGDIEILNNLSSLILNNQEQYIAIIKDFLTKGYSYPKSQELAINKLFGNSFNDICTPNNILGLEYLKSIKLTSSSMVPITIKRNTSFNSSSEIREILKKQNNIDNLNNLLPKFSLDIIKSNIKSGKFVSSLSCFEKEILFALRKMSISDLKEIPDIPDNLITKFKKASDSCNTVSELISVLKNKSITQARIQRILLYILLGISKQDMEISKTAIPYIRVLGTNTNGKKIISSISKHCNVITSVKKFEETCNDKNLLRLLEIDKFATNVYTLAYTNNSVANLDYSTKIIEFP